MSRSVSVSPLEFEITRVDCICFLEVSEEFRTDSKTNSSHDKRALIVRAIQVRLSCFISFEHKENMIWMYADRNDKHKCLAFVYLAHDNKDGHVRNCCPIRTCIILVLF